MKLYEFEAKKIFEEYEIPVPRGYVYTRKSQPEVHYFPVVLKAQILRGKRMKHGGVLFAKDQKELDSRLTELFEKIVNGSVVDRVLVEEKLDIEREYYLSITWHTGQRRPVVICARTGGIDIEELKEEKPEEVVSFPFSPSSGLQPWEARAALRRAGFTNKAMLKLSSILLQMWECFRDQDARLVEINPLIESKDGKLVAGDAKVILDDDAFMRHPDRKIPKRSPMGRPLTEREETASEIDEGDDYYRGTASKYMELDGDIAVLFSGGGASIAASDALIAAGGRLANFTEYSGNPPKEKVYKLARVALSKPGLKGLWICGGTANFTRIDTTMSGIVDALREIQPQYPIVVRRAGPYEKEGLQMLRDIAEELNLDIEVHGSETPMTATAKTIVDKAY